MKITAEKPQYQKPRFVKVSVSGFRPFYMMLEGTEAAESVFSGSFGVELEAKERPSAKPKAKRGRKPKVAQTQTVVG